MITVNGEQVPPINWHRYKLLRVVGSIPAKPAAPTPCEYVLLRDGEPVKGFWACQVGRAYRHLLAVEVIEPDYSI